MKLWSPPSNVRRTRLTTFFDFLAAPVIHTASGTADRYGGPLRLLITNPNRTIAARILYKVNGGDWLFWQGEQDLSEEEGITSISAFVQARELSGYSDSSIVTVTPCVRSRVRRASL